MALSLKLNGTERRLENLEDGATLVDVIVALGLKADRVAVECNGEIAPRSAWPQVRVVTGDRLEVVHFVGGGSQS
jgi:sulfur carrier protein